MNFREVVEDALDIAHDVLGITADYIKSEDLTTVPGISITIHSSNTNLFQNIELDERQVLCSIKKSVIPVPMVGDTFTDIATGNIYEVDANVHETPSRTMLAVRADWQYA